MSGPSLERLRISKIKKIWVSAARILRVCSLITRMPIILKKMFLKTSIGSQKSEERRVKTAREQPRTLKRNC